MNTVKELLKNKDIDITNYKSPFGNKLIGDLSLENYTLDFDKPVNELTDNDKYQIARSVIMPNYSQRPFTQVELIERFDDFFGLQL